MLKPITVRSHTGPDGMLTIRVPTEVRGTDVNVVVIVDPVDDGAAGADRGPPGWPQGFLEKMYGSLAESGLERHPQGDYEARDRIG